MFRAIYEFFIGVPSSKTARQLYDYARGRGQDLVGDMSRRKDLDAQEGEAQIQRLKGAVRAINERNEVKLKHCKQVASQWEEMGLAAAKRVATHPKDQQAAEAQRELTELKTYIEDQFAAYAPEGAITLIGQLRGAIAGSDSAAAQELAERLLNATVGEDVNHACGAGLSESELQERQFVSPEIKE